MSKLYDSPMQNCSLLQVAQSSVLAKNTNILPRKPLVSPIFMLRFVKYMNLKHSLLAVLLLVIANAASAQLVLQGNQTALTLAQTLAGAGVTVSNAVLNCDTNANALFSTPPPNSTNLGLTDGIVLTSGNAYDFGAGNLGVGNPPQIITGVNSDSNDVDLALLITQSIRDACKLEFDFVPTGDTVKFEYVFGSCEYPSYTCSINDVFGFFINGPGIAGGFSNGAINIAIVPGTTSCPVGVNSINCPNSTGCCNTSTNCVANGPGCGTLTTAQTCAMFVCNAPPPNGTQNTIVYPGFTIPLTAVAVVVPCSTYHLKLAISDASDQILDSGVFLKAGSLTSNSVSLLPVSPLSIPDPYIVEGCVPGGIVMSIPAVLPNDITIYFNIGGTAINGTDYQNIADSIVIPAGSTSTVVPIVALSDGLAEGMETVVITRTIGCSGTLADSAVLRIFDSLQLQVLNSDTFICVGDTIQTFAIADPLLDLQWSPANLFADDTVLNTTAWPNQSGMLTLTGTLANSGCPPVTDGFMINLNPQPAVNIGPDVFICAGMSNQFSPTIVPAQAYTYQWTPSTYLNNPNIINPLGTFPTVGTYTYILQADPAATGCSGFDTVIVEVLPNDFALLNGDTSICLGQSIQSLLFGDPRFTYGWAPPLFASSPNTMNTLLTPNVTTTFTVIATYPGCPPMVHDFNAIVEPVPVVNLGTDRSMCLYDTIMLSANVTPPFANYIYTWAPTNDLSSTNTPNTTFSGAASTSYTLSVTTPNANCIGQDIVNLTVFPGDFTNINVAGSNTICPGDSLSVLATGGVSYNWVPLPFITNPNGAATQLYPISSETYTLYAVDVNGCIDTNYVYLVRANNAVVSAGPDVTLYPGDQYTFPTVSNGSEFMWTPSIFLSATDIPTPIVSNANVSTQYIVYTETEYGCIAQDTVIVNVSPTSRIALPNAFTPGNGRGLNDVFSVDKLGLASLDYLRIYNRWGQLVFETNDITKGWDGRYKDEPQPKGVYVYEIRAKDNLGNLFTRTGNLTLIR
jgi:gliding motility-associated-like protein